MSVRETFRFISFEWLLVEIGDSFVLFWRLPVKSIQDHFISILISFIIVFLLLLFLLLIIGVKSLL